MQMAVLRCVKPDNLASKVLVDIDKLQTGEVLVIDTGQDQADVRVMFFTRKDGKGLERWWELRWNVGVKYERARNNF